MNKKFLLFVFFLTACSLVKAQDQFITYNNEAERILLRSAAAPVDFVKLALVSDVSENEAKTIILALDRDIEQLRQESAAEKDPEKKFKKILQTLHNVFLKNYENNASFSSLFTTGNYQCVGASILYAYVLEQYKIPYQIKETTTHIFVVAYPETYNIPLETIDPAREYIQPDEKVKRNYVNAMIKLKYVTEDYVNQVGLGRVFDDFVYSQTSLTLKDAVSFLYYNKSVLDAEKEKEAPAYSNIMKAEILAPVKRNELYKKLVLSDLIGTLKFTEMRDWEAITYLSNNTQNEETKKYILYQFDDLLDKKLWKEGQKQKVDEVFNYLHLSLKDTSAKTSIEETYYYENGRYDVVSNNFIEGLTYLEKAYAKSPNNPLIKSMITEVIVKSFLDQSATIHNIVLLDRYTLQFPFMATDQMIMSVYLYNYAYLGYMAFVKENKTEGDRYLKLVINKLDNLKPGSIKNDIQIAGVFGKASEFYYRKEGKQKCLQILNMGLKYFPDSEELNRKVKLMNGVKGNGIIKNSEPKFNQQIFQ